MAKPGPKPRTPGNTRRPPPGTTRGGGRLWRGYQLPPTTPPAVREHFIRLASALGAAGTRTKTDPSLVLQLARQLATIDAAAATVASEGLTLDAANGIRMPHPAVAIQVRATALARGLMNDMGLTAKTARFGAASAVEPEETNTWGGLLGVVPND